MSSRKSDSTLRLWPLAILGAVAVWIALALALNHLPSAAAIGAAAGSSTHRDPLFLIAEITTGLLVRRWWHLIMASIAVSTAYTILFNGSPLLLSDGSIRMMPFIGRALSMLVLCSVIAIVADLCRKIFRTGSGDPNP